MTGLYAEEVTLGFLLEMENFISWGVAEMDSLDSETQALDRLELYTPRARGLKLLKDQMQDGAIFLLESSRCRALGITRRVTAQELNTRHQHATPSSRTNEYMIQAMDGP